jgi:hypothetical protein
LIGIVSGDPAILIQSRIPEFLAIPAQNRHIQGMIVPSNLGEARHTVAMAALILIASYTSEPVAK